MYIFVPTTPHQVDTVKSPILHRRLPSAWLSWDSTPGNYNPETRLESCQVHAFVDCHLSLAGSKARQGNSLRYCAHDINFALVGTFKTKIIRESESYAESAGWDGGEKEKKRDSLFLRMAITMIVREKIPLFLVAVPNLLLIFKIVSAPEYTLDCDLRNVIIKPIRETKTCKDKSPQCHL